MERSSSRDKRLSNTLIFMKMKLHYITPKSEVKKLFYKGDLLAASENSGLKGNLFSGEDDDDYYDSGSQLAKPDNNLWDDWDEEVKED